MNFFRYFCHWLSKLTTRILCILYISFGFANKQAAVFSGRLFILLFPEGKFRAVKGCKVITGTLRPANQLEATVFLQKHFRTAKLAVVVIAHGEAVGTGIMDAEDVAHFDFRQAALDGELVVVFTKTAGDIIHMVQNGIFLAQNSDMMVTIY